MITKEELKNLRITESEQNTVRKPTVTKVKKKQDGYFLKGPIPWNWLSKAARLSGHAIHVAISIWFWHGILKTRTFKLSFKKMRELGVERTTGYRGLDELEAAGLVEVERKNGRQPIITILDCPSDD